MRYQKIVYGAGPARVGLGPKIPGDAMAAQDGQRILIVDDDPGIRRTLQTALSNAGYNVPQACDGSEAMRLWRDHGGDLVITDLHMPEKDGIETIMDLTIEKPFTLDQMVGLVGHALRRVP